MLRAVLAIWVAVILSAIPASSQQTGNNAEIHHGFHLDTLSAKLVALGQWVGQMTASNNPTCWNITGVGPSAVIGYFTIDCSGNITVTASGATGLSGQTGQAVLTVQATNAVGSRAGTATINYAPSAFRYNSSASNPNGANIGIHWDYSTYWITSAYFADVLHQSAGNNGPWDYGTGGGARSPAPLDATGAPTSCPAGGCGAGFTGDYPSGTYTLSWQGTGSVRVPRMGTVTVTNPGPNQINTASVTVKRNPGTQTTMAWTQVVVVPPVTNIHLMAPASNNTSPDTYNGFLISAMQKIAPFSTHRFMTALNTNSVGPGSGYTGSNTIMNWNQRSFAAESAGNTSTGIPYEDIINFANTTGKNVWITIPVMATDNYICRLARLFAYGESGANDNGSNCSLTAPMTGPYSSAPLNTQSKVYVELGNEIWNDVYPEKGMVYCMAIGVPSNQYHPCGINPTTGQPVTYPPSAIAAAALANSALGWDNGNAYSKTTELELVMTKRNGDLFKQVFGSRNSQIVNVYNTQAGWYGCCSFDLQWMANTYGDLGGGPAHGDIDSITIAPYVDSGCLGSAAADLRAMNSSVAPGGTVYSWIQTYLTGLAGFPGVYLTSYEGGQGLSASPGCADELAAQGDPGMFTFYQNNVTMWKNLAGRTNLYHQLDTVGNDNGTTGQYWGALINLHDPGSQKWDGLLSEILIPGDANGDGVVNQQDCAIVKSNYSLPKTSAPYNPSDRGYGWGFYWSQGDFNHDGMVGADDLAIMNHYIQGGACTYP
jgi:hypothetical protein